VCILVGLIVALIYAGKTKGIANQAATMAKSASTKADAGLQSDEALAEQGAIGDAMESVAKLATSLKDLDVGTRILVVGLALYAVAGIAAGLDAIGVGIGTTGQG